MSPMADTVEDWKARALATEEALRNRLIGFVKPGRGLKGQAAQDAIHAERERQAANVIRPEPTTMDGWRDLALEAEASLHKINVDVGRPANPAKSPDAKLIERACKVLGITRTELAARIADHQGNENLSVAVLSRANKIPLADYHRTSIMYLIEQKK